jgi:putative membrane protein
LLQWRRRPWSPGLPPSSQQKAPAEAVAFAKKVASANTFEMQSSELAKDRAQSGDVKSFAEQMIKDHTKAGNDFKSAVEEANISPPPPEEPDVKQKATLAKLKSAQGAAFDKAYVSAQLTAHKAAVSLFPQLCQKRSHHAAQAIRAEHATNA